MVAGQTATLFPSPTPSTLTVYILSFAKRVSGSSVTVWQETSTQLTFAGTWVVEVGLPLNSRKVVEVEGYAFGFCISVALSIDSENFTVTLPL
jgi:hypothetical protein